MLDEIPLSRPDITDLEIGLVNEVLRSGRLSIGPVQERFEQLVARRAGRRFAIAVSSGTAGLHLALLALGVGAGDEVITTPFSFIASANAILYTGATPVFVDIDPQTLNMDPAKVEAAITAKTKAILAVEVFGNPAQMDDVRRIAAAREITLVEDCCEGFGGSWRGRPIGSFGRVGVFGFYPNKQITTGEGGMIVTDDDHLAALCRSMRNHGRSADADGALSPNSTSGVSWLQHERLGFNFRLSEVSAAIGVGQMQRLDELLERRERVAEEYIRLLAAEESLVLPTVEPATTMSWFVFVVRLSSQYTREERDRIIEGLRRHDIGAASYFPCIHLQPFYRERFGFKPGDFPAAESVSDRTIALPFHPRLSPREIDLVVQTLQLMIQRENIKRT